MADVGNFTDPSTLTPLFIAQQTICAYQISDFYARPPRYLYYALLLATFITQWTGWLANVFLGGAAAYAGVAAIQAFILRSNRPHLQSAQDVTIPLVRLPLNNTFASIQALVANQTFVTIQPAALELDVDPILAITVVGCLVALPVQCWSHVVRANRARHLIITVWNILMLSGVICALTLWPLSLSTPDQYKFCYPSILDPTSINRDAWPDGASNSNWNETVWGIFSNLERADQLSDNCFYPCFNTTQILRRSSSLTATDYSPYTAPRLSQADLVQVSNSFWSLSNLVYAAVCLSAAITILLLFVSHLKLSRVSATEPKVLWRYRRELLQTLHAESAASMTMLCKLIRSPLEETKKVFTSDRRTLWQSAMHPCRFAMDVLTIFLLVIAMIVSPLTIIAFLVWIEISITDDGFTGESPQQVGQWSTSVSVALVLFSAVLYRLKYVIASADDIRQEIQQTREHLQKLEGLLETKERV